MAALAARCDALYRARTHRASAARPRPQFLYYELWRLSGTPNTFGQSIGRDCVSSLSERQATRVPIQGAALEVS